jgi:hypothetical protein
MSLAKKYCKNLDASKVAALLQSAGGNNGAASLMSLLGG